MIVQMELSINRYSTAKGYVQFAYIAINNHLRNFLEDDTSFVLPFHFLIGFSVELYLKSFLLHRGMTEGEFRKNVSGHDLDNLLIWAKERGMKVDAADRLVRHLHEGHKKFTFRYMPDDHTYSLRFFDAVFSDLDELDHFVDLAIGASSSYGKEPSSGGWSVPGHLRGWRLPRGSYESTDPFSQL